MESCLRLNPAQRQSADEALNHGFLTNKEDVTIKPVSSSIERRLEQQHESDLVLLPDPGYIGKVQKEVNSHMRSILVDWLIDVAVHFELHG